MIAVPGYNPLTIPVEPTDAIKGAPLLQEPPGVEFLSSEVEPWQILVVPVIGEMANAVIDRARAINERQKYFIKCVLEYNGFNAGICAYTLYMRLDIGQTT